MAHFLGEYFAAHLGVAFGADQALLKALEWEGQLPRIEAEQLQNRRLQVVDAGLAFGDKVAELVGMRSLDRVSALIGLRYPS